MRQPARLLRAALGTVVSASAAPYGYTLTVWSSGAILLRSHGVPTVAEVFAFLGGGLLGFGSVALVARGAVARMETLDDAHDRLLTGMLHWLAAGCAVGGAALIAELHGVEAWPLASFVATVVYLVGAGTQLALVSARHGRVPGA